MDKKIANNIFVGIFVTLGFGAFLFIIFTMGGSTGLFSHDYTLYARFEHVKGLNYGSEVSLTGLRIGTVKKITVSPDDSKTLIAELAVSKDTRDRIRQDSVATIRTSGVLGDKYIDISIGDPSQPIMPDKAFIPSDEPKDLFVKSGTLVENINDEFKKGGNIDLLLKNLNKVASNLNSLTTDLHTQLNSDKGLLHELTNGTSGQKLNRSMTHVEEILRKVNNGEGSLGALINDPTVYEDVKQMMDGAKRSSILKYFMRSFIDSGQKGQAAGKDKKPN